MNVWVDTITPDYSLLDHTDFVIITTAEAPDGSAAALIQKRNYQEAFEKLKGVSANSNNQTNMRFYERFKEIEDSILLRLVKRIHIISSSSDIVDVEKDIQKQIRYSCKPDHVPLATERIEGWWFQECIRALISTNPVITTQRQLHAKVYEITRQYGEDNLPIEFWNLEDVEETALNPRDRIFLEQLRLLQYHSRIGRWFAGTGKVETIYTILGVRP